MAVTIQMRRDTAAAWTSANPTLAQGELGLETDTTYYKIGNGSTAWNSLAYGAYNGAIPSNTITSAMIVNDTIVNADINSSAAIAYSKLALSNSVVNADINSSADIAATKISGTAIVQSIIDAKGDLIAGSADNTVVKLSVGTDGFSLIAASAETSGMKWINVAEDDQVILGSRIFG